MIYYFFFQEKYILFFKSPLKQALLFFVSVAVKSFIFKMLRFISKSFFFPLSTETSDLHFLFAYYYYFSISGFPQISEDLGRNGNKKYCALCGILLRGLPGRNLFFLFLFLSYTISWRMTITILMVLVSMILSISEQTLISPYRKNYSWGKVRC